MLKSAIGKEFARVAFDPLWLTLTEILFALFSICRPAAIMRQPGQVRYTPLKGRLMHTPPSPLEEKAAETVLRAVWNFVRNRWHAWFRRTRELERRLEAQEIVILELEQRLEALECSVDPRLEALTRDLVCRPEDDSMYWEKDGSGGPYCPTCLNSDRKVVPLKHGTRDGSFYCHTHHWFETAECRARRQTYRPPPPRVGQWS